METHPPQNDQLFIEDHDIEKTDQFVNTIDTSLPNSQQRFQSTIDPDAFIDSFVSETNVLQFFDIDQSTAGGPPGVLSIFEGSVSLVSQATRASVLHNMNSLIPQFDSFGDEDLDTRCAVESFDSASESSREDSADADMEVWDKLRTWCHNHHVSRDAMSELLLIFIDMGHDTWPRDWRTITSRLNANDALNNSQNEILKASITHVCGACFLVPFPDDVVAAATVCPACDVASVNCTRYQCQERCIVTSKLGKRSIATLKACSVCLISSLSFPMHRTFHFSLKTFIERSFADRKFAYACLSPFLGHFNLSLSPGRRDKYNISFLDGWIDEWKLKMQAVTAPSELWHGNRFYNHPIWPNHGPRSLLVVVSLDWFPPFKSRDYSVGILTATVANLTSTLRADRANTWVLAVLEGPREPAHTFYCLAPVFLELRDLDQNGIEVYDALTDSLIRVHVSCGPVSADVPACAKLGDHRGHGGFQPCISCNHTGSVCGCKSKPDEEPVGRWNNTDYTQGRPKLLTGTIRPKRAGEHVAFLDHELVLRSQQRPDLVHRAGQLSMARFLERKDYTKAAYDRLRATTRSNGVSPMLLLDPSSFSFTVDMTIDAMHTVLKGVVQRLWRLCMSDEHKRYDWNVHHIKGNYDKLKDRLISFKFPSGHTNPTSYADRVKSLKAQEMFVLVRVCGWLLFESLICDDAVRVWYQFCQTYTNLLHTHVSRAWVSHPSGLAKSLSKAHQSFENVFGSCHMPSNFHRVLHARLDFENWGPLRTHWTFPFERLYGALMLATKHCNRSSVTQSIVNAIPMLYSDRLNSTSERQFRRSSKPHDFLLQDDPVLSNLRAQAFDFKEYIVDDKDQTWRPGNFVCVVRANESVDEHSVHVIAAVMQRNPSIVSELEDLQPLPSMLLILRRFSLKWLRIGPRLHEKLLALPIDYAEKLGAQIVLLLNEGGAQADSHICGVVQYQYHERPTFMIPFCGMVQFHFDDQ
jgi:hypothetical protein